MKLPMTKILAMILFFASVNGSVTANNCRNDTCKIIALDAPFWDTVYDTKYYDRGLTNAHAIKDIISSSNLSNVRVFPKATGSSWLNDYVKLDRIIDSKPDLIMLHTSSFYSARGIDNTIDNFHEALAYLSDSSDSFILVYGSNFSYVRSKRYYEDYLLDKFPSLEDRFKIIRIPDRKFLSRKSSKRIIKHVKRILDL